ncbi:hypothetical protein PENTCL1PPCAC_4846, partial [Pristionchus entomophagus]
LQTATGISEGAVGTIPCLGTCFSARQSGRVDEIFCHAALSRKGHLTRWNRGLALWISSEYQWIAQSRRIDTNADTDCIVR